MLYASSYRPQNKQFLKPSTYSSASKLERPPNSFENSQGPRPFSIEETNSRHQGNRGEGLFAGNPSQKADWTGRSRGNNNIYVASGIGVGAKGKRSKSARNDPVVSFGMERQERHNRLNDDEISLSISQAPKEPFGSLATPKSKANCLGALVSKEKSQGSSPFQSKNQPKSFSLSLNSPKEQQNRSNLGVALRESHDSKMLPNDETTSQKSNKYVPGYRNFQGEPPRNQAENEVSKRFGRFDHKPETISPSQPLWSKPLENLSERPSVSSGISSSSFRNQISQPNYSGINANNFEIGSHHASRPPFKGDYGAPVSSYVAPVLSYGAPVLSDSARSQNGISGYSMKLEDNKSTASMGLRNQQPLAKSPLSYSKKEEEEDNRSIVSNNGRIQQNKSQRDDAVSYFSIGSQQSEVYKQMMSQITQNIDKKLSSKVMGNYNKRTKCQCGGAYDNTRPCRKMTQLFRMTFKEDEKLKGIFRNHLKAEKSLREKSQIASEISKMFPSVPFFREIESVEQLKGILSALSEYYKALGEMLHGLNFIAGSFFYHSDDWMAFWLSIQFVETLKLTQLQKMGRVGLEFHFGKIENLLSTRNMALYRKLFIGGVQASLYMGSWVKSGLLELVSIDKQVANHFPFHHVALHSDGLLDGSFRVQVGFRLRNSCSAA